MSAKKLVLMLKTLFLIFLALLTTDICGQQTLSVDDTRRNEIIQHAEKYLGRPYRTKVDNQVFDCSGFVKFNMKHIKKNVTRSSVTQIHDGVKVHNISEAKPGDIVVFKGRSTRNIRPGHVGLVHHISNDTLYFIHSSTSNGIVIGHLHDNYYSRRFLGIRDVITTQSKKKNYILDKLDLNKASANNHKQ